MFLRMLVHGAIHGMQGALELPKLFAVSLVKEEKEIKPRESSPGAPARFE
jgi:hypothetical protein